MASGFTHILLSRKFIDRLNEIDFDDAQSFRVLLARSPRSNLFELGSIAPDLPYPQEVTSRHNRDQKIADFISLV